MTFPASLGQRIAATVLAVIFVAIIGVIVVNALAK